MSRSMTETNRPNSQFSTADLKARIDLVDFIERDGIALKQAGASYKACCPFHNEKSPSFVVDPRTQTWHCYGACATSGDVFSFVMKRESCDFPSAMQKVAEYLGIAPSADRLPPPLRLNRKPAVSEWLPPATDWQTGAWAAWERSVRYLWSNVRDAQDARAYLHARGLSDETIRRFGLGFNPRWTNTSIQEADDKGKLKALKLAPGIVIPCFVDGALCYLKVRCIVGNLAEALGRPPEVLKERDEQTDKITSRPSPKYLQLRGGKLGTLFNADTLAADKTVVITEGEFDAMLAQQQLGEAVAVVTIGSASNGIPARWQPILRNAHPILIPDADTAGQGFGVRLYELFGDYLQLAHIPLGMGKDVTDFVQAGGMLVDLLNAAQPACWLSFGLPTAVREVLLAYYKDAAAATAELIGEALRAGLLTPTTIHYSGLVEVSHILGRDLDKHVIEAGLKLLRGQLFSLRYGYGFLNEAAQLAIGIENKPKRRGAPTQYMRVLPYEVVSKNLETRALPRLIERHYRSAGPEAALAEVTAAWFIALEQSEAAAEMLAEQIGKRLAGKRGRLEQNAADRVARDMAALRRALTDRRPGTYPTEWRYPNTHEYRAGLLRQQVEVAPHERRSKRSIARSLGAGPSTVAGLLKSAGLENTPAVDNEQVVEVKDTHELRKAGRGAFPKTVECLDGRRLPVRSWPEAVHVVALETAHGQPVAVRLNRAPLQKIVTDSQPPIKPRVLRQPTAPRHKASNNEIASSVEATVPPDVGATVAEPLIGVDKATASAPLIKSGKYRDAGHDPAWVFGQLLLGVELVLGYRRRGDDQLYDPTTGEILPLPDAMGLVVLLLGESALDQAEYAPHTLYDGMPADLAVFARATGALVSFEAFEQVVDSVL